MRLTPAALKSSAFFFASASKRAGSPAKSRSCPQQRSSGSTTGVMPAAFRMATELRAMSSELGEMWPWLTSKCGRHPTKNITSDLAVAFGFDLRPCSQEVRSWVRPSAAIIRIHEYICPDCVGHPSSPRSRASTRESLMNSENRTLYGHRSSHVLQVRQSHNCWLVSSSPCSFSSDCSTVAREAARRARDQPAVVGLPDLQDA